jgi:hypothetical protein
MDFLGLLSPRSRIRHFSNQASLFYSSYNFEAGLEKARVAAAWIVCEFVNENNISNEG